MIVLQTFISDLVPTTRFWDNLHQVIIGRLESQIQAIHQVGKKVALELANKQNFRLKRGKSDRIYSVKGSDVIEYIV